VTTSNLDSFLARCAGQVNPSAIDPRLAVDDAIRGPLNDGALDVVAHELDDLVRRSADESAARKALVRRLGRELQSAGPPDGTGFREWLLAVQHAAHRVLAGDASLSPEADESDGFRLPRASRFTDGETANTASTHVLRQNEAAFRAWASERGGWQRQHYYADLGRAVGTAIHQADGDGTRARSTCTAAVVVMAVDPSSGRPFILTSYPEIGLDTAARNRFPDLCHWFGGYFGLDHEHPWSETRSANLDTRDPARSRVRSQLDDLLSLDDDTLARVVPALGSYVLPERMRSWVEATRWRLDAFAWPREGRDPRR
jgi:Bacterial CdiA-CT RNAse A domain